MMLKKNLGRDQPITKDWLYHSMVWSNFEFIDNNEVLSKAEFEALTLKNLKPPKPKQAPPKAKQSFLSLCFGASA